MNERISHNQIAQQQEELAQSAGQDAEAWEPVSHSEAASDTSEQEHDEAVYEQLQELIQNYRQRNDGRVDTLTASARGYLDNMDEIASELSRISSQLQYQPPAEAKEVMQRFVQDKGEQFGALRARLMSEGEEGGSLAHESHQLAVDIEDASAGHELSEDGRHKLRKVREVVEEVAHEARALTYADEESQTTLTQMLRTMDELMYSNSGMEMYAGQLRQYIERLSESLQQRYVRLSRVQGELENMKT